MSLNDSREKPADIDSAIEYINTATDNAVDYLRTASDEELQFFFDTTFTPAERSRWDEAIRAVHLKRIQNPNYGGGAT